jgi:hypothetical protein
MEQVAKLITARLRQKALGALAVLNREAFAVARTDFAHLLVKDPLKAYEVLLKYSNGNKSKARLILRSIFIGVLGDLSEVDRIITMLEKGDPSEFKKALERLAKRRAT